MILLQNSSCSARFFCVHSQSCKQNLRSKTFKKSHHIVNETHQESRNVDTLLPVPPSLPPSRWGNMSTNLSAITALMGDGFFRIRRKGDLSLICCNNPDLADSWGDPLTPERPLRFRQVRHNCHAINNIECCKPGDRPLWRECFSSTYYTSICTILITHYCQSFRTITSNTPGF